MRETRLLVPNGSKRARIERFRALGLVAGIEDAAEKPTLHAAGCEHQLDQMAHPAIPAYVGRHDRAACVTDATWDAARAIAGAA